jgi:hypothetical protein
MNINLKDTLVDDTIIVQVQPVLEQVQTVTTHFDIVGNLLWDNLFAPLLFGISIPLVYKFVKKLLKRYNLKKYQSKIIREDQYKVLVNNVCLEDKYFRVNKINDDEFIIPFPETREKNLEELGFRKVYKKNKNQCLHNSLYNYISKYYGEQLTYRGENYSIPEFITRLSEETADVFIHEMHQAKLRFNKYLYGIYDVRVDEDDKCEISVYNSDYFTYKCTVNLYNALATIPVKSCFPDFNVNVAQVRPFYNSVAVGGFVIIDRGNGDELVTGFRGENCQSGGYWHFSYDETFTEDDKSDEDDQPNLMTCLRRALSEELGILRKTQEKCIPTSQITFLNVGVIRTAGNDNRLEFEVCSFVRVCLSEAFTLEDFIHGYRFAKDAEIETRCLEFIPIKELDKFISTHKISPESKHLAQTISLLNDFNLLGTDKEGYHEILEANKQ